MSMTYRELYVPSEETICGVKLQIGTYYYEVTNYGEHLYTSEPKNSKNLIYKLIVIDKDYFKYYNEYTEENFTKFNQVKEAKRMLGINE